MRNSGSNLLPCSDKPRHSSGLLFDHGHRPLSHSFSDFQLAQMKATLLVVALLAVLSASSLAQDYHFDGNSSISDPDGTLTFRSTYMAVNNVDKWAGFRSVRVSVSSGDLEIDTLGGFVSYKSIPFGILLYWGSDVTWTPSTFTSVGCT